MRIAVPVAIVIGERCLCDTVCTPVQNLPREASGEAGARWGPDEAPQITWPFGDEPMRLIEK
jgi:hypothetical protein